MSSVIDTKGVATTKKDKFLIGFNLDALTQEILFNIHSEMQSYYKNTINSPTINKDTSLPYHMTIIGGIKIDSNLSTGYMTGALEKLKPFQKDAMIPKLIDIESAQLNGNMLGIRLKFEDGTYVITGCPESNMSLAKMLGVPHFNFDAPRHVTLCEVWGGLRSMDKVWLSFKKLTDLHKSKILELELTPYVWKDTKEGWRQWIA